MSETATVQVAEAKFVKDGVGQKGPWSLWHIVDGNGERFATFSKSVYESALPLVGKRAEVDFTENDKGKTLTAIREASTNGDTPSLGTGEYVTGQKPPIEARRIAASTAAHVGTQLTAQFFQHRNPTQEVTPDYVQSIYDAMEAHVFLKLAKRGDFLKDPEDFPF